jgi:hypothetical protein
MNQQRGEEMAEQQDGTRTEIHYGARPVGGTEVCDYWGNQGEAAEAASLPGWEMVRAEVTEPEWVVIPNPLTGKPAEPGVTP